MELCLKYRFVLIIRRLNWTIFVHSFMLSMLSFDAFHRFPFARFSSLKCHFHAWMRIHSELISHSSFLCIFKKRHIFNERFFLWNALHVVFSVNFSTGNGRFCLPPKNSWPNLHFVFSLGQNLCRRFKTCIRRTRTACTFNIKRIIRTNATKSMEHCWRCCCCWLCCFRSHRMWSGQRVKLLKANDCVQCVHTHI